MHRFCRTTAPARELQRGDDFRMNLPPVLIHDTAITSMVDWGASGTLVPVKQVTLEPKLKLDSIDIQGIGATASLTYTPTGDANNDGSVGFDDFVILSGNFGMAEAARWDDGDFDGDGHVGFVDFVSLANNFAQTPVAVPEPTSWLLLLVGAPVGISRRRFANKANCARR